MPRDLKSLIESWPGETVVTRHDRPTGAWIFIALHDSTLGQPSGGTRLKVYEAPEEGLLDALRLAEGMTAKWAVLDFDYGGGKAVIALDRPLPAGERPGLLRRYGQLLESLRGAFATGVDMGTTPQDMQFIARTTRWVHGMDNGQPADPSPFTARGVLTGMEVALAHLNGSGEPRDRTVLVQGTGAVGGALARLLAGAGARVLVADVDAARAAALAAEIGAACVAAADVYDTPCDVYAPCAVGATLNASTIPRLRCRIVAGSANNQLAEPADAARLHERGILYAPDYVINGGGALTLGSLSRGVHDHDALVSNLDRVGASLREIFAEAGERAESPVEAARRRVERVLARGPVRAEVLV